MHVLSTTDDAARIIGEGLGAEGFSRKGRTLRRPFAEGVQIVHLQGTGSFCVNIGVYFPELARMLAPYTRNPVVPVATARAWDGQLRCRLDRTLPAARESWWLTAMERGCDLWFDVDEPELADVLRRISSEYLAPWLRSHATLEAIVGAKDDADTVDDVVRIAALVALGQRERARDLYQQDRYTKRERTAIERMLG